MIYGSNILCFESLNPIFWKLEMTCKKNIVDQLSNKIQS